MSSVFVQTRESKQEYELSSGQSVVVVYFSPVDVFARRRKSRGGLTSHTLCCVALRGGGEGRD